jgi:hypothetical protein
MPDESGDPRGASARRRRRATRIVLLSGLLLLVVTGVAGWIYWHRGFASAEEIADMEARVERGLWEARSARCERPVLRGSAIEGDGTAAFLALFDPHGRFADCADVFTDPTVTESLLLDGHELELPEEGSEPSDEPETPPTVEPNALSPPWGYRALARPLHRTPLASETRVMRACEGLDVELQRIVQHASVCTPSPLGDGRFDEPEGWGLVPLIRLVKAAVVIARDHIRRGEHRHGVELLLDLVRLGTDMQRGRPWLLVAMMGSAAVNVASAHLISVLQWDLPWTPEELADLERQARLLATDPPRTEQACADEQLFTAMSALREMGWEEPPELRGTLSTQSSIPEDRSGPDPVSAMLAAASDLHRHFDGLCLGASTRAECLTAMERAVADAEAHAREEGVLGRYVPQLDHASLRAQLVSASVASYSGYLVRGLRGEALVRALPALFVHRRLAITDGRCPDAARLEAALAPLGLEAGFGGRFEVFETGLAYRPLEVSAPSWLGPPPPERVRLPLFQLYCPPFPVLDVALPDVAPQTEADVAPESEVPSEP